MIYLVAPILIGVGICVGAITVYRATINSIIAVEIDKAQLAERVEISDALIESLRRQNRLLRVVCDDSARRLQDVIRDCRAREDYDPADYWKKEGE